MYPGAEETDDSEPPSATAFTYPLDVPATEPEPEQPAASIPPQAPAPVLPDVVEPTPPVVPAKPPKPSPSAAQLESLQAAASSGDLSLLKKLFRNALDAGEVGSFALANDASPRTGLTALHAAASRGHLVIVQWRTSRSTRSLLMLICSVVLEECGAIPDIEDKEGEVRDHHYTHFPLTNRILAQLDRAAQGCASWTPIGYPVSRAAPSRRTCQRLRWLDSAS